MRKKKIIGIILAAVLVAGGLGSFAYANEEPVNKVWANFSTQWYYDVPGDTFTNHEVTGRQEWSAGLLNLPDGTGAPVTALTISLDSGLAFDQIWPEENPTPEPPYEYEWDFGNVAQESRVGVGVGFRSVDSPGSIPVDFKPGFDASRLLDKTVFLQSDGTQVQTLTITLTPRETTELGIVVIANENELVSPVITSATNGEGVDFPIWPDGHEVHIWPTALELHETYTYYVTIEVTPKVSKVEWMPYVYIGTVPTPAPPPTVYVTGNSFEYDVHEMGTWTWNTGGSYTWHWKEDLYQGVSWRYVYREIAGIEDFAIKEMVIDFDPRPNEDEIAIKNATFRLQEGTYALSVDDVTVIVDGVVITIPAGSFVQGKGGDYIFKTPKGVEPKLDMKLNFDKGEWHFKVDKIDASAVDNCDGVDVTLFIGPMGASERVDMSVDRLLYKAGQ